MANGERSLTSDNPYHKLAVIPDIDRKILDGIASGKSLKALAIEYDVSDTAVLNRAHKHPEYREKLALGIELRMDTREMELEGAFDNVGVSRARELLSHARWVAERTVPERYAPKNQLHVTGSITLDMVLAQSEPEPIEGESERVQDQAESVAHEQQRTAPSSDLPSVSGR